MKKFRLSTLALSISSLFIANTVYAAAFQLYELGTPVVGTADVGQAALANDASTAYFNPAGMTRLSDAQFMIGSQLILPYTNFSKSSNSTILGDNGGNAATLIPGMSMYYVYSYSPDLKFGVSFTSPYGGSLSYTDGWIGRFVVQDTTFYTLNLNPSLAYRFNQYISAGAGVALEYANLQETVALPLTRLIDGQANIKVDNLSAGVNFGVLLNPNQTSQIGVAYRSRITHSYHGNTTFLRIGITPDTSTQMVMPQNVIISLAQMVSERFTFLGELGWSNWSTMKDTTSTISGFTASTPRDWHDTYRVGVGGQYYYTPGFLFQAGASYDSSPTSSAHRLPDLPMDRQVRVGAGIVYNFSKSARLGFNYEYINFGNANINDTSSNGRLIGSYSRNYANVFQASVNVDC